MKHVVVVGGGFAGVSTAVWLAQSGYRVTLLERRQALGGRAFCFSDSHTGDTVDNGQHLFMKCYRSTRALLECIGTGDLLKFQPRFQIDFLDPQKAPTRLAFSSRIPAPLNLMLGLLRFRAIGFADVIALRHLRSELQIKLPADLSVEAWLFRCRQSPRICHAFWHPLCIAALNEPPARAPARHLQAVIREAFFGPPDGALLGYAQVGLSKLIGPAQPYLESRGCRVQLGAAVRKIQTNDGEAPFTVALRTGDPLRCDACVCTVPPQGLSQLLPESSAGLRNRLAQFAPSPIVSINLWFDRPIIDQPFAGLLGTRLEWLFNRHALLADHDRASSGHVILVVSAAHDLAEKPESEIVDLALREMQSVLPQSRSAVLQHARVVCEHRATHSLPLKETRPGTATETPGLFLAGDWIETGLPGTIESAVRSGERAAEAVCGFLQK